jgi:hypothetical protein
MLVGNLTLSQYQLDFKHSCSVVSLSMDTIQPRSKPNSNIQNTSFNCANSEYKGLLGLTTAGSQKSPRFGGQLRERFV